jgi:DedD protein
MRQAAAYEEAEIAEDGAELSLSMGTLLGIFFGLALVCGVFFGFGYMLGHRNPGPYVSSEPLYVAPKPAQNAVAPKPSALVAEQPTDSSRVVVPATPKTNPVSAPVQPVPQVARPQVTESVPMDAPKTSVIQKVATTPAPPLAGIVETSPTPSGNIMVQIAAVKNRSDAEALAAALRKNGFNPTIRTEPQDKLLHVQVGPLSSREDAKAMRQRLSSAGYDAFIK